MADAFSQMFSIAKSMKDMNDTVLRNEAISNLWEQIIAAQELYAGAVTQIRELKETERERRQLCDLEKGMAHLAWNRSMANGATPAPPTRTWNPYDF